MKTKLVEFKNNRQDILRGIYTFSENNNSKNCVICLSGFERNATTEKKFKKIADEISNSMPVLRLDFTGCGLSDGDFRNTTLNSLTADFIRSMQYLEEKGVKKFNIVAHSLGGLIVANYMEQMKNKVEKIVLLSPALNQKDLLRYWFVTNKIKKENPNVEITWDNYGNFLNEDEFLKDCRKTDKITKANFIKSDYFLECQNIDSSGNFKLFLDRILHIYGSKDAVVPLESVNVNFSNQIIVEGGDHDLEKPNQMEQWLKQTVNFLK